LRVNLLTLFSRAVEALVAGASQSVVTVEAGPGTGTGFAVAGSGGTVIVTNAHVIEGQASLILRETGGRALPARQVGRDAATDLAVLAADDLDALALPLASRRLPVGALVVAIGNPLRFDRSVSLGVVSAVDRSLSAGRRRMEGLVQHDAALNPGNSGGPLLDTEGEVAGVNAARVPWAEGIGFAVPAHTVRWVIDEIVRSGSVRRPRLGVQAQGVQLGPREAARTGRERAVRITEVRGGTPASRAGVRAGDLVLDAGGEAVASVSDLQRALVVGRPDHTGLRVLRDGRRIELAVRLPGGR
jgi:S1-C subfamily serine protease